MALLGYLLRLKRGLVLAFGAHVLYDFFIKFSLMLYQLTKFQCHTFTPLHVIKQNALLSSYLGN